MKTGKLKKSMPKNTPLQKKCQEVRQLLQKDAVSQATIRYKIGEIVVQIEDDPNTYGTGAIKTLARETCVNKSTLYDFALVARRWREAEFEELLKKKGKGGMSLSWSHFVELATVEDDESRASMAESACEHGLSVRKMRQHTKPRRSKPQDAEDAEETSRSEDEEKANRSEDDEKANRSEDDETNRSDLPVALAQVMTALRGLVAYTTYSEQESSRWDKQIIEPLEAATVQDERLLPLLSQVIDSLRQTVAVTSAMSTRLEQIRGKLQGGAAGDTSAA